MTGQGGAGRVILFGATGYTGRLAAESMVRAGLAPVLAGRSAPALADLVAELAPVAPVDRAPTWQAADAADPVSVRDLVTSTDDVLVTTVGPFTELGGAAVAAALESGCAYVDSTGEPGFLRWVFAQERRARASGARLLPAFGYDYVPGNLAGALALADARERGVPVRVDVGYFVDGSLGISTGTRASLAAALADPGGAFRSGRLGPAVAGTAAFDVGGTTRRGMQIGGSEHYALPRLAPSLRDVGVYLGWAGPWTVGADLSLRGLGAVGRVPVVGGVLRSATRRAAGSTTGGGPSPSQRRRGRTVAVARATDGVGRTLAEVTVTGPTPYELTAELLAWAAALLLVSDVAPGVHGPVDAFGLAEVVDGCAAMGLVRDR